MASKRILKRNVNDMIIDIVEECFTLQLFDEKKTKKTDALIDEAADFQDDILTRINAAKNKADFKNITTDIETKAIYFVEKLNALN